MHRLRFSKTGNCIWISHLDTMRLFQRAFRRAEIEIRHTEGFNPHAFVSIALPMSVGTESDCELLDFTLTQPDCTLAELPSRLNPVLPQGVCVLDAYDSPNRLSALKYLRAQVTLVYDSGVPNGAAEAIDALFRQKELIIPKKTKRGMRDTDILPLIRELRVLSCDAHTLLIQSVTSTGEASLNPDLLAKTVSSLLPELAPDFFRTRRLDVLQADGSPFC